MKSNRKKIIDSVNRKMNKIGHKVYYKAYNKEETEEDSIFKEAPEKEFDKIIPFQAIVRHNPPEKVLTELGIQQDIEVLIRISTKDLLRANLLDENGNPNMRLDTDIFEVRGKEYNISVINTLAQMRDQHMVAIGLISG